MTPLRSTCQVTIWVMSVVTPLTTPVAENWNVAGVSMPAALAVSVTDADVGLTESDSRPLIGGRVPMPPPTPVLPPVPVVAPGLTPAHPPVVRAPAIAAAARIPRKGPGTSQLHKLLHVRTPARGEEKRRPRRSQVETSRNHRKCRQRLYCAGRSKARGSAAPQRSSVLTRSVAAAHDGRHEKIALARPVLRCRRRRRRRRGRRLQQRA